MLACRDRGHEIFVVGPGDHAGWQGKFLDLKMEYVQVPLYRNSINPLRDIVTISKLTKVMNSIKPEKVFLSHAKMIVYGAIACRRAKIKDVYLLVAGLGSILRGTSFRSRLLKPLLKMQYRFAFGQSRVVFVQNKDDAQELLDNRLIKQDKIVIVNGSGVDLIHYPLTPLPSSPVFLFLGRLLRDKGIFEYLEACKELKKRYPDVRCLIVGSYDSNPSSLRAGELEPYIEAGIVEYCGQQEDVRPFIAQCSTLVLPSYHEGTPRSVLEAMSMGRSIITTDAPGCRETVIDEYNGYLVPVGDSSAIAQKMIAIAGNYPANRKLGANSRLLAEEKFDVHKVNDTILRAMDIID